MEPAVTNIASKLGVTPAQVLQTLDSPPVAGGAALGRAEGLLCHSKVRKPGKSQGSLMGVFFLLMLNHLKNLFTNVDAKCMSSIQGAF